MADDLRDAPVHFCPAECGKASQPSQGADRHRDGHGEVPGVPAPGTGGLGDSWKRCSPKSRRSPPGAGGAALALAPDLIDDPGKPRVLSKELPSPRECRIAGL